MQQLAEVKATIDELKSQEQELRDTICTAIGDAESISYQGRRLATWKQNKPTERFNGAAAFVELHLRLGMPANHPLCEELSLRHTTTTEGARVLRLITSKEE